MLKSRLSFRIFSLCAFALLVTLGLWQLKRLEWKEGLIAAYEERVKAPLLSLPKSSAYNDEFEFRRVSATGVYLHDGSFLLIPRGFQGQNGAYLITPMMLLDRSIVLVNRGWIPPHYAHDHHDKLSSPDHKITVTGMLRKPPHPNLFTPKNKPDQGQWYQINITDAQRFLNDEKIRPYYIQAFGARADDQFPIPLNKDVQFYNQHFEYALTWFALALTYFLFYLYWEWSEYRLRRQARNLARKLDAK